MVSLEEDNLFNSTSSSIDTEAALPGFLYKSSPLSGLPDSLEERMLMIQLPYVLQTSVKVPVSQVYYAQSQLQFFRFSDE